MTDSLFPPASVEADLIRAIVQEELQALGITSGAHVRSAARAKDFHTVPEIRLLITKMLPDIRRHFGERDFSVVTLCDFIGARVQMRPGDVKVVSDSESCPRWEQQFYGAMKPTNWPDGPFLKADRRGRYRLRPESLSVS